jgi:hypothetical protein
MFTLDADIYVSSAMYGGFFAGVSAQANAARTLRLEESHLPSNGN